jgi:hypothetical protein
MHYTKQRGYVLHRGPSPIDGKPIVVIAVMNSSNRKTGNMIQTYILRDDLDPLSAVNSGDDASVCGDCPHRKQPDGSRSCYVNVGQSVMAVWRAYQAKKYKELWTNEELEYVFSGRGIRWGAYGDPACIPHKLVAWLNKHAANHTGYTHQWRAEFASPFKGVFMASCDGFTDYCDAMVSGWKSFTVTPKGYKPSGIKQCPATVPNSQAQCVTCSLCSGDKLNVFVEAHGSGSKYVTNLA